ncbi:hypothetical protein [Cellulomonas septica]|nr:hypothetical protein [Cellulomonas septica]
MSSRADALTPPAGGDVGGHHLVVSPHDQDEFQWQGLCGPTDHDC